MAMRNSFTLERIARTIANELNSLFVTEAVTDALPQLLSVKFVKVSRDLSIARVYVGTGVDDEDESRILKELNRCKPAFRSALANRLNLRRTPDLEFYVDDLEKNVAHIEQLLNSTRAADAGN